MFNELRENFQPYPPEFSVYNGRDCIGRAAEEQRRKWATYAADDQQLGNFPNCRAATDAIMARRRVG